MQLFKVYHAPSLIYYFCFKQKNSELSAFGQNTEDAIDAFKKKCSFLKKLGTLALRGKEFASNIDELQAIPTSQWKSLQWIEGPRPTRGYYSVPSIDKEQQVIYCEETVTEFCLRHLKTTTESESDDADE